MRYLVISCSLNPDSKSGIMARVAHEKLAEDEPDAGFLNLADHDLPLCDGGECYGHPSVAKLSKEIEEADGILLAAAIYNYDVNAAAKNLLEMTGRAWTEKVVAFILAAGGEGSYMSVMPFANSLMLDYRTAIVPRFVYATGESFQGKELDDPEVERRLFELTSALRKFTKGLRDG